MSLPKRPKRIGERLLVLLSSSLLIACHAPTVPLQLPAGELSIAAEQLRTALTGPYKVLAVQGGIKIRVYQNGARIIADVPYARQGNDNTCGQAVINMLTNFWGVPTDYQQLVNQENPFNLATLAETLVRSLREKGLNAQDFREAGLASLAAEINQGRPTAVLLDFGSIPTAHYVLVVGYNPQRGTLIMHDSLEAPYVEMSEQNFLKMWENRSLRSVLPINGSNYRRLMFQAFR
ncbi:MAG: C39 family peptidase [Candidatus Sericytochromatia bacterium]